MTFLETREREFLAACGFDLESGFYSEDVKYWRSKEPELYTSFTSNSKNLTAQQRANIKQNELRKNEPRYQLRMSEEEAGLLNNMGIIHGSKKAAIIAGLKLLKENDRYHNRGQIK